MGSDIGYKTGCKVDTEFPGRYCQRYLEKDIEPYMNKGYVYRSGFVRGYRPNFYSGTWTAMSNSVWAGKISDYP